jgi:hypothetical protein
LKTLTVPKSSPEILHYSREPFPGERFPGEEFSIIIAPMIRPGRRRALLLGAVPFVTLVLALPFVNRLRPTVLGLPFLLFWILLWVALTTPVLYLADRLDRRGRPPGGGEDS